MQGKFLVFAPATEGSGQGATSSLVFTLEKGRAKDIISPQTTFFTCGEFIELSRDRLTRGESMTETLDELYGFVTTHDRIRLNYDKTY